MLSNYTYNPKCFQIIKILVNILVKKDGIYLLWMAARDGFYIKKIHKKEFKYERKEMRE